MHLVSALWLEITRTKPNHLFFRKSAACIWILSENSVECLMTTMLYTLENKSRRYTPGLLTFGLYMQNKRSKMYESLVGKDTHVTINRLNG